jgi:proteasome assembly chaperone (PAC2) family protein
MDAVIWEARPQLNRPVMVAAFEGWNDAADAASGAVTWLRRRLKATQIARIDPEEFYDFQATRPEVSLIEGSTRKVSWPANKCYAARVEEVGRDLVLFSGVEPNLRWRTFCSTVIGLAKETGCEMVVTLGALLADVPHTRPTRLTGTAIDPELIARLGLSHSRYEGPTGIVGVFQDACVQAGVPAISFWAAVPHYVSAPPSPKATLALLHRVEEVLDLEVPLGALPEESEEWEATVSEMAEEDDEVASYVRALEERGDTELTLHEASGDAIAADFERYLRRRGGSGGAPGPRNPRDNR